MASNSLPADPWIASLGASALGNSALNSYGVLPNPQAAYEALVQPASLPAVSGAISSQDPQFKSLLSSLPAGLDPTSLTPYIPPLQLNPAVGVMSLQGGWAGYQKATKQALQDDKNSSWKSLGEIPAYNFEYLNTVLQHSDPKRVRQWQDTLHQQGFYRGPSSGVWSDDSKLAFAQMIASRAVVDALYSPDTTTQNQAGLFLNNLGIWAQGTLRDPAQAQRLNFDLSSIQSEARDPALQHRMVVSWMMAQGPDQKFGDKRELDNFISLYGKQNLPAAWQSVTDQSNLGPADTIAGGAMNIPILGGILRAFNPAAAQTVDIHGHQAAQNMVATLKKAEGEQQAKLDEQLLSGVVTQTQQNMGFMSWMSGWDLMRSNALISTHYLFGDVIASHRDDFLGGFLGGLLRMEPTKAELRSATPGKQLDLNPFDPAGLVGQQTAAADGDLTKALVDGKWDEAHAPWWAAVNNTVANMADDPISYVPVGGVAGKVGQIRNLNRLADWVSPTLGDAAGSITREAFRRGSQADMSRYLSAYAQSSKYQGPQDLATLLGGVRRGPGGLDELRAIRAAARDGGADAFNRLITDQGMEHRFMLPRQQVQRNIYLRSLTRLRDISRQDFVGLRAQMSLRDLHEDMSIRDNPVGYLHGMQEFANFAGMDDAAIAKHLDTAVDSSEEDRLANHGLFRQEIFDSLDRNLKAAGRGNLEDLLQWAAKNRTGRSLSRDAATGRDERISGYLIHPVTGEQLSYSAAFNSADHAANELNLQLAQAEDGLEAAENVLTQHSASLADHGIAGDPAAEAQFREDVDNLRKRVDDLTQRRDQHLRRAAPITPSQLASHLNMPFSMYELIAYSNPALKNWERINHTFAMNAITSAWKPFALARLSTFLRIVGGEDIIRPTWDLAFGGDIHDMALSMKLLGTSWAKVAATLVPSRLHIPLTGLEAPLSKRVDSFTASTGEELPGFTVGKGGQITGADGKPISGVSLDPTGKQVIRDETTPLAPGSESLVGAAYRRQPGGIRGRTIQQAEATLRQANASDLFLGAGQRLLQLMDRNAFIPFRPGMSGYAHAVTEQFAAISKDPLLRKWLDAYGKQGAADSDAALTALRTAWHDEQTPAMQELRRINPTGPKGEDPVDLLHQVMSYLAEDPQFRGWLHSGAIDRSALTARIKNEANDPTSRLPIVLGRRNTLMAEHTITRMLNAYPAHMFEDMLSPMLTAARSEGFLAMKSSYLRDLKRFYKGRVDWGAARLDAEANHLAAEWMRGNVYMGHRSMLGTALRNVYPFWGATANMSRFYLRQAMSHPFSGEATLRLAKWSQDQQQGNQQYAVGFQGLLAHMGFTGGDAISVDPAHAFFLTSDGVVSFIPGPGPVFAPVLSAVAGHQNLAEALQGIPGVGNWLNPQTGAAQPLFPWMAKLISGAGTAITGSPVSVPFLGEDKSGIEQSADQLIRQREQQGQQVTQADTADIYREVGRKLFVEGGLSWALPMTPSIVNQPEQQIDTAMNAWRAASDDKQKDQVVAQAAGVKPAQWAAALRAQSVPQLLSTLSPQSPAWAMAFMDSRVSSEQRDAIAAQQPWVVAWATSAYNEAVDPTTGKVSRPLSLSQFQSNRLDGTSTIMAPQDYAAKVSVQQDIQRGWLQYDQIQNQKYAWMRGNGVLDTTNPLYKQYDATVLQPQLEALNSGNKPWSNAFGGGGTSTPAQLAKAAAPLSSLSALEVIPQNPNFETTSSTLWRQALVWRDEAAREIAILQLGTHSTAEIDLVMQGLQQRLAALAGQDPSFAAELNRYTFNKWEDVINLEAGQIKNQELYGGY